MIDLKLAKGITIGKSIFDHQDKESLFQEGRLVFKNPEDFDLVILCGNSGGGYIPYRCLLPHQVYVAELKKAFEEYHFEVIYALPVRSRDAMLLVGKSDYEINRWEK